MDNVDSPVAETGACPPHRKTRSVLLLDKLSP